MRSNLPSTAREREETRLMANWLSLSAAVQAVKEGRMTEQEAMQVPGVKKALEEDSEA